MPFFVDDIALNEIVGKCYLFLAHIVNTTTIDQVLLGICGVTAVWLSQDTREKYQKLAPVFGLMGQPFWLYATYKKELWVMFALCWLYTYSWYKGFRRWHLKKEKPQATATNTDTP